MSYSSQIFLFTFTLQINLPKNRPILLQIAIHYLISPIHRDDEEPGGGDGDGDEGVAIDSTTAAQAPVKKSLWAPGSKKSHNKGGAKNKRTVAQKPPKVVPPPATSSNKSDAKASAPPPLSRGEPAIADSDVESGDESDIEESGGGGGGANAGGSSEDEKKQVSSVEDDDVEWEKFQQKLNKREKLEGKSKMSHSVHCPHYPEDKQEYWWTYICDRKSRTLLTAPYHVTNLVDAEEIQLKFTAPRWPGVYTFTVCLRSGKLTHENNRDVFFRQYVQSVASTLNSTEMLLN